MDLGDSASADKARLDRIREEEQPFWFSDVDREGKRQGYQPCFQPAPGLILDFDIWFPTSEACEEWIKEIPAGTVMR